MPHPTPAPVAGALVIPLPRISRTGRSPADALGSSPEFDAGFNAGIDFALTLVRQLKARGQLSHLKGA